MVGASEVSSDWITAICLDCTCSSSAIFCDKVWIFSLLIFACLSQPQNKMAPRHESIRYFFCIAGHNEQFQAHCQKKTDGFSKAHLPPQSPASWNTLPASPSTVIADQFH